MKDKILEKYFKYDSFVFNLKCKLIEDGKHFIERLLIETQEREYYIDDKRVSEEYFFKEIPNDRCYFETHTWMTCGHTHYNKRYRNTLILEDAVKKYKETLDEIDLFILGETEPYRFCHSDYNGCYIIPNTDWKEGY